MFGGNNLTTTFAVLIRPITGYCLLRTAENTDIVIKSNLLKSKSEVRRAIKNFGIKVNNNTINNESSNITIDDFKDDILKLSHGKKNHVLFKITH